MRPDDFRINEHVRRTLARHWIDTSKLDYGTTDRVVFMRGVFTQIKTKKRSDRSIEHEQMINLIKQIEKEVNRIPGVSGIVMKLRDFKKEGGQWKGKTH